MTGRDEPVNKPIDDVNATINLLSALINLEILGTVREHLGVLKQSQATKALELDLKQKQAANDLRFYEAALNKLDAILERLS